MLLASLLVGLVSVSQAADDEPLRFNRDIRPILADKCFACHGPDKNAREAELRLDTHEGVLADLGNGHAAIVPGDAAKSELVRRINSNDPDEAMPPKKHPKQLTADERKLLEEWVAQGAPWEGHWAYLLPTRSELPATSQGEKLTNPIDRFIAARLEAQKLPASPEADRRTLIRRLSFDLTGLPPQAADVEAFVNDKDPKAYEKLVDRILASPHYGEQMALYWLDLVRFADTAGYHSDNPRDIAPYRDYVIRSFNENLPFDRFTVEQLAGDLLPSPTLSQQVASGYNRLLQTTEEGGAQAKEYEAIYFADRVRNFSTVWMASTMGCCQCHDHKFDPFSQKDFYSMAAFFADVREAPIGRREPGVPVPSDEQTAQQNQVEEKIAELKKQLDTPTPELAAAQASWEQTFKETKSPWQPLEVTAAKSSAADVKFDVQADGSVQASGPSPEKDVYTVSLKVPSATGLAKITALRLELLADDSLPKHGPGRSATGHLSINGVTVEAAKSVVDKAEPVALAKASASFLAKAAPDAIRTWKAAALQDEKKVFSFTLADAGQIGQENRIVLPLQKPLAVSGDTILTCTIKQETGKQQTIGRFRISATDQASPAPTLGAALEDIAATIAKPDNERSVAAKAALAAHYRATAPLLQPVRKELAAMEKQKEQLVASIPRSLVSVSMAPKTMRIKARGNWMDESGQEVQPAVPEFMKPIKTESARATRLDLANWLVAADHPLTSRVLVNRLWKQCFGQGLVKSLEDLGLQGDVPTHPELLDWLAVECRESGWNVKHMIKLMVMSNTYRQTSMASKVLRERDPYNKLLGRQGRFRFDAEVLRDNALAMSGLLVDRIGGPSAKPYQPDGYWVFLNFPKRDYPQDHGENLYRRSLYTHWQRSFLHPSLLVFDAPSREECVADRPRSNTPQQALVLLNDPIYVEAYRVLAEKIVRTGGDDFDARLRWAFVRVLSRDPKPAEIDALRTLYDHQLQHYQQETAAAEKVISVGEWPVAKDLSAAELAAWTAVARTMMNLHETISRL